MELRDDRGIAASDFVNRIGPENLRLIYNKLLTDRGISLAEIR